MATNAVTRDSNEDLLVDSVQKENLLDPVRGFHTTFEREQETSEQNGHSEAQSPTAFEQQQLGERPTTATALSYLLLPSSRPVSTYSDPGSVCYNDRTTFEPDDHASGIQLSSSRSETCLFVQGDIEFTSQDQKIDGEDSTDSSYHVQQARPKDKSSLRHRVTKPFQPLVPLVWRFLTRPRSPPQLVAFRSGLSSDGTVSIINLLASGLVLYWSQSQEQSQLLIGAITPCDPDALFEVLMDSATGEYQFRRSDGYLGVDVNNLEFKLFPQSHPTNGITEFQFSGDTSQQDNTIFFNTTSLKFVWVAFVDSRSNSDHVAIKAEKDVSAEDHVSVFGISLPTCSSSSD